MLNCLQMILYCFWWLVILTDAKKLNNDLKKNKKPGFPIENKLSTNNNKKVSIIPNHKKLCVIFDFRVNFQFHSKLNNNKINETIGVFSHKISIAKVM